MKWVDCFYDVDVLANLHNTPFRAKRFGSTFEGIIGVSNYKSYLCQNELDGENIRGFYHEYDYSWVVYDQNDLDEGDIETLEYLDNSPDIKKLYKRVLK